MYILSIHKKGALMSWKFNEKQKHIDMMMQMGAMKKSLKEEEINKSKVSRTSGDFSFQIYYQFLSIPKFSRKT